MAEPRIAVADAGFAGRFNQPSLLRRRGEDLTASGKDDPVAVRGNESVSEVIDRLRDPVLADLVEVAGDCDVEFLVSVGRDVVKP